MAYAQSATEGKTRWEILQDTARDFGSFLYNKEKGEVMGRDGKSWAKITVFFLVFYSCLAAFFAAMLAAFMSTVPDRADGPKLTQYLAGKQGLNYVPRKIGADFASNYENYAKDIVKFLEPYEDQTGVNEKDFADVTCNQRGRDETVKGKQCRFNLTALGPCYNDRPGFDFGYKDREICIFVRMNKVFDWIPEPKSGSPWGVKLDCFKGEKEKDRTNVKVYPKETPGFPTNYYPYKIQDHWLAPLAAVHISQPKKGDAYFCEAHAKNIEQSGTYRVERGAHGRTRIDIGN